jgi:hypothetical protein
MMTKFFSNKFEVLFLFLFFILIVAGCSDVNNPSDNAPTLPPKNTMVLQVSEFPDTTTVSVLPKGVASYDNWGWAAINVHFWNSILTVTLSVPVLAFSEAFNRQPVLQNDGSWLWSYNFNAGGTINTAKLYGTPTNDGVDWKMLLTKTGSYTDFEWFTGSSNIPATEGFWILNKDPNDPQPFIGIEWSINTAEDTAQVKYTNILPGAGENGSYILYGKNTNSTYNRYYQIWDETNSNLTDIMWNFQSHVGTVNDPLHFGDPNNHCWDEMLMDTTCQ